jgi:heterodisulfide reductase subunit C
MSSPESIEIEVVEPIRSSELDSSFAKEISHHPGGEKIFLCYQCGACGGSCPVGKITDSYKPRHIIRMAMLGLKEEVLKSATIWLCASCYTCQERCPQGIEIADLMLAIRNVAVKDGYLTKTSLTQAQLLMENGRLATISRSTTRMRTKLNLPPIPSASKEAIQKIVESTGFQTLVQHARDKTVKES